MDKEERIKRARELHNKLHPENEEKMLSDNPMFLSFQSLVEFVELLADVDNEAFTQLDKGKFQNPFIDETELFARAIHFAEHPLDDIEAELNVRGIKEKKTIKISTLSKTQAETLISESEHSIRMKDNPDGTITVEEYEELPIHFEIKPLKDYAKEWMRKRHPVNRERVNEIIRLAGAARIGEMTHPLERQQRVVSEAQNLRL